MKPFLKPSTFQRLEVMLDHVKALPSRKVVRILLVLGILTVSLVPMLTLLSSGPIRTTLGEPLHYRAATLKTHVYLGTFLERQAARVVPKKGIQIGSYQWKPPVPVTVRISTNSMAVWFSRKETEDASPAPNPFGALPSIPPSTYQAIVYRIVGFDLPGHYRQAYAHNPSSRTAVMELEAFPRSQRSFEIEFAPVVVRRTQGGPIEASFPAQRLRITNPAPTVESPLVPQSIPAERRSLGFRVRLNSFEMQESRYGWTLGSSFEIEREPGEESAWAVESALIADRHGNSARMGPFSSPSWISIRPYNLSPLEPVRVSFLFKKVRGFKGKELLRVSGMANPLKGPAAGPPGGNSNQVTVVKESWDGHPVKIRLEPAMVHLRIENFPENYRMEWIGLFDSRGQELPCYVPMETHGEIRAGIQHGIPPECESVSVAVGIAEMLPIQFVVKPSVRSLERKD